MLGFQQFDSSPVHALGLDAVAVQDARLPAQFVAESVRFPSRAVLALASEIVVPHLSEDSPLAALLAERSLP